MTVLDIDLDFFVSPPVYSVPESGARPADEGFQVWDAADVEAFLRRLGLARPLPGRVVHHHGRVLWEWNAALYEGRLKAPFRVVHVDAHEDLGYGDPLWRQLQEEVLARPVGERSPDQLHTIAHSGNYLLCAVALGWVSELVLVMPEPLPADPVHRLHALSAHPLHFAGGEPATGLLQLKSLPGLPADEQAQRCRELEWRVVDTPVPVKVVAPGEVEPAGYEFLTVARSPAFCPPKADALLPLLTRWVAEA